MEVKMVPVSNMSEETPLLDDQEYEDEKPQNLKGCRFPIFVVTAQFFPYWRFRSWSTNYVRIMHKLHYWNGLFLFA